MRETYPTEDEVDVTIPDFPYNTSNKKQRQETATIKMKRENRFIMALLAILPPEYQQT